MSGSENKYQYATIYKITDKDNTECYYGATTQLLCSRMGHHRATYRKKTGYTTAHVLFDKYGLENCRIEKIENFPCNNRSELLQKEKEYIINHPCVNKQIPIRTKQEYEQQTKQWAENNKERYKKLLKDWREKNKDYHKKWLAEHPDYYKLWKQSRKEKLANSQIEKLQTHDFFEQSCGSDS